MMNMLIRPKNVNKDSPMEIESPRWMDHSVEIKFNFTLTTTTTTTTTTTKSDKNKRTLLSKQIKLGISTSLSYIHGKHTRFYFDWNFHVFNLKLFCPNPFWKLTKEFSLTSGNRLYIIILCQLYWFPCFLL